MRDAWRWQRSWKLRTACPPARRESECPPREDSTPAKLRRRKRDADFSFQLTSGLPSSFNTSVEEILSGASFGTQIITPSSPFATASFLCHQRKFGFKIG